MMKPLFPPRPLKRHILLAVYAAIFPAPALCSCFVETYGPSFGSYDVFNVSPTDGTGNIAVSCDLPTSYTLSLSTGYGTYSERRLVSGTEILLYNVYTDASLTTIWGDGSAGTGLVSGTTSGATENHTLYGRIPARQNVSAGSYADAIVVTLEY